MAPITLLGSSRQERFNLVVAGLAAQGFKQAGTIYPGGGFGCQYRGPNGTRCGIGHLIREEDYSPTLENQNIRQLWEARLVAPRLPDEEEIQQVIFLSALQIAHDGPPGGSEEVAPWQVKLRLRAFATLYGLTRPDALKLVDLSETSAQEVFNRSVAGLASQGFQKAADDRDWWCYYRPIGFPTRRCAAGWLIPDAEYPGEHGGWFSMVSRVWGTPHHVDLIRELQSAHDSAVASCFGTFADSMKKNLREVASKYNLELPDVLKVDA